METMCLFLDLDGTLLNDRKKLTAENQQAMQLALSHGHKLVVTSGRPLKSALIQAERLGLDGEGCYVIAYNGASIYDCSQRKEIFRHPLDMEDLYTLFDEANRRGIYIQTYDREKVLVEFRRDRAIARRYCEPIQMEYRIIESVRKDLTEAPVKALMIDYNGREATEPMRQWIVENMKGRVDTFFSGPFYLEAVPAGMNKGRALTELCQRTGIPIRRTIAAGDEANDISMIQAAGVGVAMKNAAAPVKAAADYVTRRDNNHDGVAEVIYQFMLE